MLARALGILVGLTLAQTSPCRAAPVEENNTCPTGEHLAKMAQSIINSLRAEPRRCGSQPFLKADPVRWNDLLFKAASFHAGDMKRHRYFSHQSAEGGSPGQRIDRVGYVWQSYGENIAHNSPNLRATFEDWLNSPPHCHAIMQPDFRHFGLACEKAEDELYWVLELAAPGSLGLRTRGK